MNNNLSYPFDVLNNRTRYIPKKLAKALIVKFLKRERIFKELVTECMLAHPRLKSVEDVLENMVHDAPALYECLFYSDRTFPWEYAKWYHIANEDGYWGSLLEKWSNLVGTRIYVNYI